MSTFDPMSAQDDVFRAASNQLWFDPDKKRFLPDAFKLRKRDVESQTGLSVIVNAECPSCERAGELSQRSGIRAVCSLNVGGVQDLPQRLLITQDTDHHAGIHGLSFTEDEVDLETIQRVNDEAEALADISEICALKE